MDTPDWSVISEQTFNGVVEALLVAEFTTRETRARAINGRGGDTGIDVGVWTADGAVSHIFQLKHYRDGWSSTQVKRRSKIRDSFERAWSAHHPAGWTLVTASNPTLSELQYVRNLAADKNVDVDVVGPAELDELLGRYPHIADRFFRDRTLEYVKALHRPEELLRKPGDLPIVMQRVHQNLRTRSAFWGSRITLDAVGNTTEELVALTADAASQEPLNISVNATFEAHHAELRADFEEGLRFGFVEPITLPADVITSFSKQGPEWWAEDLEGVVLELHPAAEGTGLPVVLSIYTDADARGAALEGQVSAASTGSEGMRIVVDFVGGLEAVWLLPHDGRASGQARFEVSSVGHRVRDVRRLARFLPTLGRANQVGLRVGDHPEIRLLVSPHYEAPEKALTDFLDDLIRIEDALDVTFRIPDRPMGAEERIWARIIVKILGGVAVPYPGIDGFNFSQGANEDGTFDQAPQTQAAILLQQGAFVRELLGTEVHVGHVFIYQAFGTITTTHAATTSDDEGGALTRDVKVRAVDDLPFVIYAPDLLPAGKPVRISGWGIPEIAEHKMLPALRQRRRKALDMPAAEQMRTDAVDAQPSIS